MARLLEQLSLSCSVAPCGRRKPISAADKPRRYIRKPALGQSNRRGIEVIEAALVMPLVLLLLFGVLEFGWMFLLLQQVTHGARAGARTAVVDGGTTAGVRAAVESMMAARGMGGLANLEIVPAEVADLDSGTVVTVTVKVRYADVGLKVPLLSAFAPTYLRASVSMAKEGP